MVNHGEHAFFWHSVWRIKPPRNSGSWQRWNSISKAWEFFRWMTKKMVEAPKKIMGCLPSINWCRISQPSRMYVNECKWPSRIVLPLDIQSLSASQSEQAEARFHMAYEWLNDLWTGDRDIKLLTWWFTPTSRGWTIKYSIVDLRRLAARSCPPVVSTTQLVRCLYEKTHVGHLGAILA